ncbi:hypothetical protein BKA56DRAFT_605431 [Ilyonectria sp. MPI-CAGE-AT-0026]|nr:hypothetical protein BKA56DRAFT_605431 [Ilyonectria sp. MPI-CAGE-AT-0026]
MMLTLISPQSALVQNIMDSSHKPPKQTEENEQNSPDPKKNEAGSNNQGHGSISMVKYTNPVRNKEEEKKYGLDHFK